VEHSINVSQKNKPVVVCKVPGSRVVQLVPEHRHSFSRKRYRIMQLTNKQIADELMRIAHTRVDAPGGEKRIVLRIGTFTIKCIDTRDHILAVAERYRKAKSLKTKQSKNWGVAARSRLNRKTISTRYATDPDQCEFLNLLEQKQ